VGRLPLRTRARHGAPRRESVTTTQCADAPRCRKAGRSAGTDATAPESSALRIRAETNRVSDKWIGAAGLGQNPPANLIPSFLLTLSMRSVFSSWWPGGRAFEWDRLMDLVQGRLDMLILNTLALEPMRGYGIAVRIERMSKGVFRVNAGLSAV